MRFSTDEPLLLRREVHVFQSQVTVHYEQFERNGQIFRTKRGLSQVQRDRIEINLIDSHIFVEEMMSNLHCSSSFAAKKGKHKGYWLEGKNMGYTMDV